MEEASRFDVLPFGLVSPPSLLSTPSFDFGRALVVCGSFGLGVMVGTKEERTLDPLTIVLDDGSEWEVVEGRREVLAKGGVMDFEEKAVDAGAS